jgi:hypothetical protein
MIGVDIVSNERIRKAVERFGERFLKRIYTPLELEYCKKTGRLDSLPVSPLGGKGGGLKGGLSEQRDRPKVL